MVVLLTECTMKKRDFAIPFIEYGNVDQLPADERQLVDKAIAAMANAYAPYSDFYVGAAVLLANGDVIVGNNQENAAYPSGLCAERVALFCANANFPNQSIVKMAVVAGKHGLLTNDAITPCGSCRQVMVESERRQKYPFDVLLVGKKRIIKVSSARYLLPFEFDASMLEG
jgi:cytidine deaminase